jgi:4-hydroxythreonine-4-phosphate dehydrogenase
LGDPAGIGPQVLCDALKCIKKPKDVEFIIIADKRILEKFKFPKRGFEIIDLHNVDVRKFSFGKIDPDYGKASIEYLKKAVELIKNKDIDCLVTLPITKESVIKAGFCWPGHTEYLKDEFKVKDVVMMLMNRYIKVSLVTRHLAIKEISQRLSKDEIAKTIILTYEGLKSWFNIKNPKLAVSALNPHASEGGIFGNEEKEVIIPAIKEAKDKIKGIKIFGPLPCDALFFKAKEKMFDAVIAMYHDQALIPLKLLDFWHGVNITLGLPFVRISPLHGTALDIAGKEKASCLPLLEAIRIACLCTLNQRRTSAVCERT